MSDRKKSNRKILWISIVVVVLAGAWWYWRDSGKPADAAIETDEVTRGALRETVSATGSLQAVQTVSVGTQVSGTIDKIYVDFNSKVKRNELLALIEPSVLDAQLESAQAAYAQADARNVDAIAALKEGEGLLAKAYISDKDMRVLKTTVKTAAAQLDAAKADLDRAKRNRQYAEIRSPIDGVVIERAVDRGQTVAASFQTPTLFTIAEDLSRMQILASVDESQIGSVKVGQAASFGVSAFPNKKFSATVSQIRLKPTVTQNVVTYAVVLDVQNATGELFPGMTATVDFVLKDITDALRVPSAALRVARIPESMMDAESLKRMKEIAARQAGGSPGANGEGARPSPEQIQAMRQRAASDQGGSSGQSGARMSGNGRAGFAAVWALNPDGKYRRVGVRILASDMSNSAIEPLRGDLKVGDKVVIKLPPAVAQQVAARSVFSGGPGRGPRR